jgi:hypothetical protein
MKRNNEFSEIEGKKQKTHASILETTLSISVNCEMVLQEAMLRRGVPIVETVREHVARFVVECGLDLELKKIYVEDTDVMGNPQALVGTTPIQAECGVVNFVHFIEDVRDQRKKVDNHTTEIANMREDHTTQIAQMREEYRTEMAKMQKTLAKHSTLLCGLAKQKLTILANEVLLRGAHRSIKRDVTELSDAEMKSVFYKLLKGREVRGLLRAHGETTHAFLDQAVATRKSRNNIAHGEPQFLLEIAEAVRMYVPVLEDCPDAAFIVFVVTHASQFLNCAQGCADRGFFELRSGRAGHGGAKDIIIY